MEYRVRKMRPGHHLNKDECCPLSFAIENCHIFFEGQCENTFIKYVRLWLKASAITKVGKSFASDNTRQGIA